MSNTVEQYLSNAYDRIERVCDRFVQRRYWRIELSFICLGLVFFAATPYLYNLDLSNGSAWEVVKLQIEDPTKQYALDNPDSHNSKHTFRLTVPIISKLLGLRSTWSIYLLQVFCTLLFFRLLVSFADRLSTSGIIKSLLPVAFCFIAIGQAGVFDVYGRFDSFSLFFLLAAMVIRSPILIFFAIVLGGFTDERAFIAAPMIFFWWQYFESGDVNISFSKLVRFKMRAVAVVLGMLTYLVLRYYLTERYGFVTTTGAIGIPVLLRQYNMYLFGVWTAFEGFWLIILILTAYLLSAKNYKTFSLLLIISLPSFLVANLVMDITRSIIYALPLLIICLQLLHQVTSQRTFNKLVLISLMINILVPTYWAFGPTMIFGNNPFYLRVFGIFD